MNISLLISGKSPWANLQFLSSFLIILAGTPTAVELSGTSQTTTEFAPTLEFAPIVIFPKIFAPLPITVFDLTVGCLFPLFKLTPPSVTP